ncbi:MAG: glycosyltransferase family 2 protein [Gammaproteobacteria bacterium]|nr:glycosyltransferase family 2 protein [Gammaproteobacteria bacterium]
MPRVSVIIPTYNRERVLLRAINSVLSQTYQDFEIIVVDDASTDDTEMLVRFMSDPRIRYIKHEVNEYAAAARNTGLDAVKGEFVAFLDSDDCWLPHKLQQQIAQLDQLGEKWVAGYGGALVNMKGGVRAHSEDCPVHAGDVLAEYLLGRFTIWTPTFIFRSSMLPVVGRFDPELVRGEDVDFYLRVLQQGKLACISSPIVELFIEVDKGIADISAECDRLLLAKHRDLIDAQGWFTARYIRSSYMFRQGERYLIENRVGAGLKEVARAVMTNPFLSPKRYASMSYKFLRAVFK